MIANARDYVDSAIDELIECISQVKGKENKAKIDSIKVRLQGIYEELDEISTEIGKDEA